MRSKMGATSSEVEEEDRLVQMVHDFIESGSPSSLSLLHSSQVVPHDHHHHSTYLTLQAILGSVKDVEMNLLSKVLKFLRNVKFERKTGSLRKWLVMKLRRDGLDASLCKSKNSWITTPSSECAGCDYEYIDIVMKDENIRLIVDLDFNSQFELARPTQTYTSLLKALPAIFVGTEEKLLKIVSILCSAAKESLKERGLHIPPWRKTSYMQSKWISESQRVVDSSKVAAAAAKVGEHDSSKWSLPKVMPKRRDLGGGSALTSQFSNMSINCC